MKIYFSQYFNLLMLEFFSIGADQDTHHDWWLSDKASSVQSVE